MGIGRLVSTTAILFSQISFGSDTCNIPLCSTFEMHKTQYEFVSLKDEVQLKEIKCNSNAPDMTNLLYYTYIKSNQKDYC